MMNKKNLPHIVTVVSFVVFIVLGLACASSSGPATQVELKEEYRKYLVPASGNERVIETIRIRSGTSFVCIDKNHTVTREEMLGAARYQRSSDYVGFTGGNDEAVIDQFLAIAKRNYPSEAVDIRNAKTIGHTPTNSRYDQASKYTLYDCYLNYSADVITTEPMPDPVTHSENFTAPGTTRADIYRRTINWIEDNTQRRRLTVTSQNIDRGRIQGTVTCAARTDQTYIVTSNYTIDVYDARVEVRFTDTFLQRTDPALNRVGSPEPIFLQSIADVAKAELVDFSTTLRSYIQSR